MRDDEGRAIARIAVRSWSSPNSSLSCWWAC